MPPARRAASDIIGGKLSLHARWCILWSLMELGKEQLERWSILLQQIINGVFFASRPLGQYDLERLSRGNEPAITNHITLLSNDSRQASEHPKRVKPPTIARKSRQATFAIKTLFLDVTYIEEDIYRQSGNCYPSLFKVWYPWSHFIRRYSTNAEVYTQPRPHQKPSPLLFQLNITQSIEKLHNLDSNLHSINKYIPKKTKF